jgi:hypothetical protein
MGAREDLTPSRREIITLAIIGLYIVVIAIAWRAPILKSILYPFKVPDSCRRFSQMQRSSLAHATLLLVLQVLTVAFHESGHALTGLCTGARIESIELDPELGGLTIMRGGIQYITLPAGCAHACWWAALLHVHRGTVRS